MKLHCPYDKMTLTMALISASRKAETVDPEAFGARLNAIAPDVVDQASANAAAALFHGIGLEALMSSASYEELMDRYYRRNFEAAIAILKDYGLTDKEAWAFLIAGLEYDE